MILRPIKLIARKLTSLDDVVPAHSYMLVTGATSMHSAEFNFVTGTWLKKKWRRLCQRYEINYSTALSPFWSKVECPDGRMLALHPMGLMNYRKPKKVRRLKFSAKVVAPKLKKLRFV